jgi:phage baseplate assembly protein W
MADRDGKSDREDHRSEERNQTSEEHGLQAHAESLNQRQALRKHDIRKLTRLRSTRCRGHVRDMMGQILYMAPGERVMWPNFGCGLAASTAPGAARSSSSSGVSNARGVLRSRIRLPGTPALVAERQPALVAVPLISAERGRRQSTARLL